MKRYAKTALWITLGLFFGLVTVKVLLLMLAMSSALQS
jgi:hypothetical protein